jgi:hypothetical protein
VKFKKDIVIRCDSMNRCKIFRRLGSIKDIIQLEVSTWSMNYRMTNLLDMHT